MKQIKRIYYWSSVNNNIEYCTLDDLRKPKMLNFDQLKNIDPDCVWTSLNDENHIEFFLKEYINL